MIIENAVRQNVYEQILKPTTKDWNRQFQARKVRTFTCL